MDIEDLQQTIRELTVKNALLEAELKETKEHLKKYTAPTRHKKFYENLHNPYFWNLYHYKNSFDKHT